jgi:hypothetical protein
MPRALFWEPAKPPHQVDGIGDRNEVLKTLIESFGRDPAHPLCPIELHGQHVFMLQQLGQNAGPGNFYQTIADLIKQHGRIRIWGKD